MNTKSAKYFKNLSSGISASIFNLTKSINSMLQILQGIAKAAEPYFSNPVESIH